MWIQHVPYEEATGELEELYDRVKGPGNNVDNVMLAHSLRSHTMGGAPHPAQGGVAPPGEHHSSLVPGSHWGVCEFAQRLPLLPGAPFRHDAAAFRGCGSGLRYSQRLGAVPVRVGLFPKEAAALTYVAKLTRFPQEMTAQDVDALWQVGWDDGEILEVNQVAAYFC